MGSKEIYLAEYRQAFAFIGVVGQRDPFEKRAKSQKEPVSITQIIHLNPETPARLVKPVEEKLEEPEPVKNYKREKKANLKPVNFYLSNEENPEAEAAGSKFLLFNAWCKKEGVIMDKLIYPAYFKNGLIGVRCKANIENRESFLSVPYKMILSVDKCENHEVLGPIIKKNKICFYGVYDDPSTRKLPELITKEKTKEDEYIGEFEDEQWDKKEEVIVPDSRPAA